MASLADRFWDKVSPEPTSGCWLWTAAANAQGYGRIGPWRAHRAAWTLCRGPIPDGSDVLHKCDVPACVNPDHLFLGDDSANMQDRECKGRANHTRGDAHWTRRHPERNPWATRRPEVLRGERNGRAKLTAAQVASMRAEFAAGGVMQKTLAQRYGITPTQACTILNGKAWREA